MASSLGDVVTLGILAGCANLLLMNIGKEKKASFLYLKSPDSHPFFPRITIKYIFIVHHVW